MSEQTPAPTGATGARGIKVGDYEQPVFDGPQPRTKSAITKPNDLKLNTENAGE